MATSVLLATCHQVAVPDEIDDRWDLEANKSPVVSVFSETSLTCSGDFGGDLQFHSKLENDETMRIDEVLAAAAHWALQLMANSLRSWCGHPPV